MGPSDRSDDQLGGWAGVDADDPEVVELRDRLVAESGIKDLEIFDPDRITEAVRVFRRDGFVVVRDGLTPDQCEFLRIGCEEVATEIVALDNERLDGNRGSHRYSFGGSSTTRSQLHRPEWQMLLEIDLIHHLVQAIFESDNYILRAASGDFCLPGAVEYQRLHSDMGGYRTAEKTPFSSFHDPSGQLTYRDLPTPYLCVNVLTVDATPINGPTRQIPGTQRSNERIPSLSEESESMRLSTVCPAPAGSLQIRDVRAWHGGTPNLSNDFRAIPNLEFYAPWFREPMVPAISPTDHKTLSKRAQRVTQHLVAPSNPPFEPRATLGQLPGS